MEAGSEQAEAAEGGIGLLPDDDVIVDGDTDRLAGDLDLLGHLDIGARRRGVARRVVVELSTNLMQHIDK